MTNPSFALLKELFLELKKLDLIKSIIPLHNLFFDVYIPFTYSIEIKSGPSTKNPLISNGASFTSREEALLKAIVETVERLTFSSSSQQKTHQRLPKNAKKYIPVGFAEKEIKYWIKTKDLIQKSEVYLPAFFIDQKYFPKNKNLKTVETLPSYTTNGMSAEFELKKAIINALYERVERDAVISSFLLQFPFRKINIYSLKDKEIKKIIRKMAKYNLRWILFDITTDLQIPTFLSLVYDDKLGVPLITPGAKANLNTYKAIKGSLLESLMLFSQYRLGLHKNKYAKKIDLKKIKNISDRMTFWNSPIAKYLLLDLINSKAVNLDKISADQTSLEKELECILKKLNSLSFQAFLYQYKTPFKEPYLKKIKVVKIFTPDLQTIFFDEENKIRYINKKRLSQIAKFFGYNNYSITEIPHFFV